MITGDYYWFMYSPNYTFYHCFRVYSFYLTKKNCCKTLCCYASSSLIILYLSHLLIVSLSLVLGLISCCLVQYRAVQTCGLGAIDCTAEPRCVGFTHSLGIQLSLCGCLLSPFLSVVSNTAMDSDVLHSVLRSKSLNLLRTREEVMTQGCEYQEVGSSQRLPPTLVKSSLNHSSLYSYSPTEYVFKCIYFTFDI